MKERVVIACLFNDQNFIADVIRLVSNISVAIIGIITGTNTVIGSFLAKIGTSIATCLQRYLSIEHDEKAIY